MNKELEEAKQNLIQQLEHTKTANECGLATKGEFNKDIKAIETVLNYIDNSISKEVIEKKLKEREEVKKSYWRKNNIMINFIDKKTAKISKEELEVNDKHMQLNGEVKALQELLKEN